jgi:hypothetical protein
VEKMQESDHQAKKTFVCLMASLIGFSWNFWKECKRRTCNQEISKSIEEVAFF